ncbi:cell division protein [Klebsiella pneumoniae]|uniref:Cell division protein n=1 Tax=Klebsiella pneumoniae TaxID=573 RepID=A0A377VDM4_KLEPN|nr:cell division protein [Klebsiella pneumoniae]
MIIQDKRLDNFGTPEYSEPGSGGFVGDTLLVNGVQSPYVEVSRGWVRLRLLNASNSRRYQLQMSDGRLLHVISGDQGFLPAPVSLKQLSLAPGERREILVDMTNGDEVSITCGEAASIVDRIRGFFEPSSILVSTLVLTLRPTGLLPLVTDSLPVRLLRPSCSPVRRSAAGISPLATIRASTPAVGSAAYRYHGAAGDLGALDGARRPPAVVPY